MTPRSSAPLHAIAFLLVLSGLAASAAQARQMPDPKQIAGMPLPVGDVPAGTVVVRVIRETLSNNIPDQLVELSGAGPTRTVKTDAGGRAQFDNLPPGSQVIASTTVGGERLQSQQFAVPSAGGIRLLLVATDPNAEKQAGQDRQPADGPAQAGSVILGEQSRFVIELADGSLSFFNVLQIVNTARTPVTPSQPVVFDLPTGATGASILQDSSPQAKVAGPRVTVAGPFAPGTTLVQFAYSMPYSGANVRVEQKIPIPLNRVIILAQKNGDMRFTSPQLSEQREMAAEGQTYVVGQGPAVAAGGVVTFNFEGLPHAPLWPRNLAIGIAVAVLLAGAWASWKITPAVLSKDRNRLETKRGQLFAELAALEEQHRAERIDP
jgi:hypothetical protein